MIIESKEDQKKLKKPISILLTFCCYLFWIITASTLILDDNRVFIMFLTGTVLYTISWFLVYRFYLQKL